MENTPTPMPEPPDTPEAPDQTPEPNTPDTPDVDAPGDDEADNA